jgi:phenylalanyl-tRNA synthetase beta chain
VKVGRITCGSLGMLHPLLQQRLDLKHEVLVAEFDAAELLRCVKQISAAVPSDFPVVRRDFTLKIPVKEFASRITRWVHETKPEHLETVGIDDFRKEGEEYRRLTLRLTFRSADRTLSNEEVDKTVAVLLDELRGKHQLELAG